MVLKPITRENCQLARQWRNEYRQSLRTPIMLTQEMQDGFFDRVAKDRYGDDRYWELHDKDGFVGLAGLTSIEWENGCAEISLFLRPDNRRKGLGTEAVRLVFEEAFDRMRLHMVYGECFLCNPCCPFWRKVTLSYGGKDARLWDKKWWAGKWWDSYYFAIFEEGWNAARAEGGDSGGSYDPGRYCLDDDSFRADT